MAKAYKRQVLSGKDVDDVGGVAACLQRWGRAYVSEKLDGIRALGFRVPSASRPTLLSSLRNPFVVPDAWASNLVTVVRELEEYTGSAIVLDGELWMGHGAMQDVQSIVRRKVPDGRWKGIRYAVFDILVGGVGREMSATVPLLNVLGKMKNKTIFPVAQNLVFDEAAIHTEFDRVVADGGEGLMLRSPTLIWTPNKVRDLVKYKPMHDDEAIVTGYAPGKERLVGMMGALRVQWGSVEFELGTGFTDVDRSIGWETRFPIGSSVTFKYTSLTAGGTPREARYWRKS